MKLSSFVVAVWLIAASTPALAAPPELQSDTEVATAGYYQLSWDGDVAGDFILEESKDPSFTKVIVLYRGPDTATLVSGRSNGVYYYRIRNADDADENAWSETVKVEVAHHPLSRAFIFFALGALVFVATLIAVVAGNRRNKSD